MTKFKEYLRAKGIKLECGSAVLPYRGIRHIEAHAFGVCLEVLIYYTSALFPDQLLLTRDGSCIMPSKCLYEYDAEAHNGFSDYVAWLRNMGYLNSERGFVLMEFVYVNDEKLQIAFRHMKAGIMDKEVFRKWHDKHCQECMSILCDPYEV